MFGLLAIAAIVVALMRYDTARRRGKVVWLPGVLGACATLMHPWQGELLIMLIVGGELVAGRLRPLDRRRLALALLTIGLTVLPLLYYAVLGRADLSWKLARDASKHDYPLWSLLLAILPLLIPALLAYRRRARTLPRCDHPSVARRRPDPVFRLGLGARGDAAARIPGHLDPARRTRRPGRGERARAAPAPAAPG